MIRPLGVILRLRLGDLSLGPLHLRGAKSEEVLRVLDTPKSFRILEDDVSAPLREDETEGIRRPAPRGPRQGAIMAKA